METMDISPASTPHYSTRCALLELPAELRNKIYEYALVEQWCIEIDRQNHLQPGLLRTCHQIRAEAIEMFYSENQFQLRVYFPPEVRPQVRHWLWTKPGRDEHLVICRGYILWRTLLTWLKPIHQGVIHVKKFEVWGRLDFEVDAVNGALSIAKMYRGLSWQRTAHRLEGYRQSNPEIWRAMQLDYAWRSPI